MNRTQFVFGKQEQQQAVRQQELSFAATNTVSHVLEQIDTDVALLETANAAQTKQIIHRLLQRQQRVIKVLRHLIDQS